MQNNVRGNVQGKYAQKDASKEVASPCPPSLLLLPFFSLSHLVRQLWLARVQWGGKVWREEEEKEEGAGGG
ncbi:Chitinase 2 [Dissostichus eleginoides]|uniref:Chitinase 2 n=1 Tax=Dissostichus eleginoides TaxID=100907 RepID=A0AAD9CGE3_DISEL|nr:Chitinase 2 [Dissostichus eleginoides]